MERIYDTVIVGGGPAGYTAALYAARAGLSVAVLEKMSVGGQMALTDIIHNYPGLPNGIDGITLGAEMQAGAEKFGTETIYAELTSAELTENPKRLFTTMGELLAKTVIVATGAEPRRLGLDGEEQLVGRGVHYCAHCDGRFYKNKTVAVIGGGNSAVSDALYLSGLASRVYLIHRRDRLRAGLAEAAALLEKDNVSTVWNSRAVGYTKDVRLSGLLLENVIDGSRSELACDGVFVSIGRQPVTDALGGQLALDKNGYIIADESTETNLQGVFVAGDVRTKVLRQIVTATADGAVAAECVIKLLQVGN